MGRELTVPLTLQVRALSGQFATRKTLPACELPQWFARDTMCSSSLGRSLNRLPGDSSIPKIITNYGQGIADARPLQRVAVETRFRLLAVQNLRSL